jgi:hypothetical protein
MTLRQIVLPGHGQKTTGTPLPQKPWPVSTGGELVFGGSFVSL